MQVTMTGEYAIRAMIGLASLPYGTIIQINEISFRWDIPENFLRKIITLLGKSGVISSQRGIGGGIRLSRPAEQTTLLDVIEAVEGKIFLNKCLIGPHVCARSSQCPAHIVWSEAQEALQNILGKRSLAELAAMNNSLQAVAGPEQQDVLASHYNTKHQQVL